MIACSPRLHALHIMGADAARREGLKVDHDAMDKGGALINDPLSDGHDHRAQHLNSSGMSPQSPEPPAR